MITRAVLAWLVIFAGSMALSGFLLYVARSFGGRRWSNLALIRWALMLAFLGATVAWVLLLLID